MNVKEINLQFHSNYTKIYGIDHLEKNLINIKIDSNKLKHYFCEYPINVTLDPKNLDKITQKIDKNYIRNNNIFTRENKINKYNWLIKNSIIRINDNKQLNTVEIINRYRQH